MTLTRLAIKINDGTVQLQSNCSLCAAEAIQPIGPALFEAESMLPVCRTCGVKHAPQLVALLDTEGLIERAAQAAAAQVLAQAEQQRMEAIEQMRKNLPRLLAAHL
jgi:hypothetical protein